MNLNTNMKRFGRLRRSMLCAFLFALAIVFLGTSLSVYQNWQVRVEASKAQLVRHAELANMLLEHSVQEAKKTLEFVRHDLQTSMRRGEVTKQDAHEILKKSKTNFKLQHDSKAHGRILWIDSNGHLIASDDEYQTNAADYSAHVDFLDLKFNPEKEIDIGPMLFGRMNDQWVFHLTVPVLDEQGQFKGVLVQELSVSEIALQLQRYSDLSNFSQMMTYYNGHPASFQWPVPTSQFSFSRIDSEGLNQKILKLKVKKGSEIWESDAAIKNQKSIIGFANSSSGLLTLVTLPVSRLYIAFLKANYLLFSYFLMAIVFICAIFYYVYQLSVLLITTKETAVHDPLTMLHNRRALDETLPQLLRESKRSQEPISVLFIDIDFFRRFNENYGHHCGDIALQKVAKSLSMCCKRPLDLICRWGGEEFVAVLPHTNEDAAQKIANDMLKAVRSVRLKMLNITDQSITVSIGIVSIVATDFDGSHKLVDAADKAMQKAKEMGRNQAFLSLYGQAKMNRQLKYFELKS